YTLHYKTDDGNWQQEQLSSDADKYTLRNLRCGTRYHLYMTASNSLGTGEPSEAVSARTKGAGTWLALHALAISTNREPVVATFAIFRWFPTNGKVPWHLIF
ncbi:hypothetical protein AVEN_145905-1, partial [Araneus ventricosus]